MPDAATDSHPIAGVLGRSLARYASPVPALGPHTGVLLSFLGHLVGSDELRPYRAYLADSRELPHLWNPRASHAEI